MQHKVLSQNIKQGLKKQAFNKRLETAGKGKDNLGSSYFNDFKNFVRPSTSAVDIYSKPKLMKMNDDSLVSGPKFISLHEKALLKDVKSYKDINKETERKIAAQPIHFRMLHYEDKKMDRLTTAPETNGKSRQSSRKRNFTMRPNTNLQAVRPPTIEISNQKQMLSPKVMMQRWGSAGNIETKQRKK